MNHPPPHPSMQINGSIDSSIQISGSIVVHFAPPPPPTPNLKLAQTRSNSINMFWFNLIKVLLNQLITSWIWVWCTRARAGDWIVHQESLLESLWREDSRRPRKTGLFDSRVHICDRWNDWWLRRRLRSQQIRQVRPAVRLLLIN